VRRTVVSLSLGAVLAVLAVLAVPALAVAKPPVGVQTDTHNGVFVATTVNGQPAVGVFARNGQACVWVSLQVPFCRDLPAG
jgi:hypothetical protein